MTDYARDDRGRLLDVPADASPQQIQAAIIRRNILDAANLDVLRSNRRLFNQTEYVGEEVSD